MASKKAVGERACDLIARAAEAGFEVSPTQLARWHRRGLLRRPWQQSLGRGKGTECLYPAGTGDQLLALCELRKQTRLLGRIGWGLCWRGYPVDTRYWRPPLRDAARTWDHTIALLKEPVDPESYVLSEEAVTGLEGLRDLRTESKVARQARKRVGRDRFSTLARILLETAVGAFQGWDPIPSGVDQNYLSDKHILERGLGLERARTDKLTGAGPWLADDTAPTLVMLAKLLRDQSLVDILATSSDKALTVARDDLQKFLEMFGGMAQVLEAVFGKHAFGFGVVGEIGRSSDPKSQARLLLLWLMLKQSAELGKGIDELLKSAEAARVGVRAYRGLELLREKVPAFSDALRPSRLQSALTDGEEMKSLHRELGDLYKRNRESVEALLLRYPELNPRTGE
jgi:hypothetical protein